jgi:hypothetical protein
MQFPSRGIRRRARQSVVPDQTDLGRILTNAKDLGGPKSVQADPSPSLQSISAATQLQAPLKKDWE